MEKGEQMILTGRKKTAILAAVCAVFAFLPAMAQRIVTCLDGNDWTLDGLPVLVPNTWNKADGADGVGGLARQKRSFGWSVRASTYARRSGMYVRSLPDAQEGRRYFVRCEGASQSAVVRVNGIEIGSHKGAFTAFCFEATEAMKSAGNVLEIQVSNEADPTIPPFEGDFNICGGLYRSVWLIETDPVCIDPTINGGPGVRVFPSMDGTVRVEADVSGADDAVVDWEPNRVENPRLWSPEEPNVYAVTVTVKKAQWSDTVVQPFGFRTVEIREDGFYLNGAKRKVRGVNRHQDFEGVGWEMTPQQDRLDFRLIKAMGADAVRLTHYPQNESVYDICDSLGLMVWTEIPFVETPGEGKKFDENLRIALREMVAQKRNHPCVCWWGAWNEVHDYDGDRSGDRECALSHELAGMYGALDPSRPVVAATCTEGLARLNASVPNVCYNKYPGWYTKESMKACLDGFFAQNPLVRMIALSEYGAGASIYHHENPPRALKNPVGHFHPEEWQTKVHMDDYRDIRRDSRLWGSFVWAMFDFAADSRREGDRHGINDKGLVTRDRTSPKDAYFFYKANWNPERMLHLCGKRMSSTTNGTVQVVAFSNAGDVTLKLNGDTVATKKPDEISSAVFDNVALREGENAIRVEAGALFDECRWIFAKEAE